MALRYKAPRGTSDLIFPASEKVGLLIGLAAEILRTHGYRLISTPLLENTELFRRGIGEHTDIVTKEMYTFEDRGGESLTLRPEGTAPVVRAFLENSLSAAGLPQKLFYYGPMFRRERPQAGRFRQFLQIGAEAIGSDDPFLDAEIIAVNDIYFRRLGLSGYRLLINSVGCRECRPSYVETLAAFLGGVSEALCEQCRRRSVENPLRVFDCKNEQCMEALEAAPVIGGNLCPACLENLEAVLAHLEALGVPFEMADRLVRGLDYYTRTTFEFQFEGLGAQNAVCGGGRYDYLAEELGGPPTPGVGFSLGVERLVMALEAQGLDPFELPRLDVFVAAPEGADRSNLLALLTDIRRAGLSADTDFQSRSLKAQMKQASRLGARFVVIVGPDEQARGEAVVRDLDLSEQSTVAIEKLIPGLQDMLKKALERRS